MAPPLTSSMRPPVKRRSVKPTMEIGGDVTSRHLLLISAALFAAAACAPAGEATGTSSAPLPTTVNCGDASTLKAQAADARRDIAEQKGDRAKIIKGNRAKFLASLAVVAELRCKASAGEVAALLEKALEVGRVAETTRSEYEAAREWTEADLVATEAITLLASQLPALPSP
jgi:hypothetical protein